MHPELPKHFVVFNLALSMNLKKKDNHPSHWMYKSMHSIKKKHMSHKGKEHEKLCIVASNFVKPLIFVFYTEVIK